MIFPTAREVAGDTPCGARTPREGPAAAARDSGGLESSQAFGATLLPATSGDVTPPRGHKCCRRRAAGCVRESPSRHPRKGKKRNCAQIRRGKVLPLPGPQGLPFPAVDQCRQAPRARPRSRRPCPAARTSPRPAAAERWSAQPARSSPASSRRVARRFCLHFPGRAPRVRIVSDDPVSLGGWTGEGSRLGRRASLLEAVWGPGSHHAPPLRRFGRRLAPLRRDAGLWRR